MLRVSQRHTARGARCPRPLSAARRIRARRQIPTRTRSRQESPASAATATIAGPRRRHGLVRRTDRRRPRRPAPPGGFRNRQAAMAVVIAAGCGGSGCRSGISDRLDHNPQRNACPRPRTAPRVRPTSRSEPRRRFRPRAILTQQLRDAIAIPIAIARRIAVTAIRRVSISPSPLVYRSLNSMPLPR